MRRLFSNDAGRTGWFDHLLSLIGGCLVLYSAGMAVSQAAVGDLLIGIYLVGKLVAWLIGGLAAESKFLRWDGIVYVLIVVALGFGFGDLNRMLGADTPFQGVFTSLGFLSFMIALGSFATWRDGTMLFQAVPGIAIFGLVGCFDTFRPVTYFFFGFLLCIATLFARINARNMLDFAVRSGAPNARVDSAESPLRSLRQGPWRSVAGPTWALLSAAVIVILSFLGAPVLRDSVQGVVGHLKLPVPSSFFRAAANQSFFQASQGVAMIGRGPVSLGSEPVLRIAIDEPRYLRSYLYHSYTGRGWERFERPGEDNPSTVSGMLTAARQEILTQKVVDFSIEMLTTRGGSLPVPGEVTGVDVGADAYQSYDGTYILRPGASLSTPFRGRSVVADSDANPRSAQRDLTPEALDMETSLTNVSQDVIALARRCTADTATDWEKANAIKDEIDRRVTYDISAPAVPDANDPISYTLFVAKRGYCDVFASSMVVMARAVGIPARYVIGFYPFDTTRDSAGRFTVEERDAHAWAELYFRNFGWVVFDATDNAAEADGSARGSETGERRWYDKLWFLLLNRVAAGVVFALIPIALLQWRDRRRLRNPAYTRVARIYARFNRALERKSGRARQPHETPEEYLAGVRGTLNGTGGVAAGLTADFLHAMFGPNPPDAGEYETLLRRVRDFERAPKNSHEH